MKKLLYLLPILSVFFLHSCQKDAQPATVAEAPQESADRYTAPLDLDGLSFRSGCPWAVIPAGSVDALAAAIAGICDDGVIYLKAGMHTENSSLTISKPVKIIGETGAILKIKSDVSTAPLPNPLPLHPALHILNAPGALVQDLDIQPLDEDGGCAILLENSHGCGVMRNKFTGFQFAILVEKSDRTTIMFNNVTATGKWQTGELPDVYSIVNINGKSPYISDNTVTNSVFGIWACDEWGTAERNETTGNMIGLILCKVPAAYQLPSGEVTGSLKSGTGWKVNANTSTGNFDNGIMVIDGASQNRLWNNTVHGNGLFPIAGTAADIETFS